MRYFANRAEPTQDKGQQQRFIFHKFIIFSLIISSQHFSICKIIFTKNFEFILKQILKQLKYFNQYMEI